MLGDSRIVIWCVKAQLHGRDAAITQSAFVSASSLTSDWCVPGFRGSQQTPRQNV